MDNTDVYRRKEASAEASGKADAIKLFSLTCFFEILLPLLLIEDLLPNKFSTSDRVLSTTIRLFFWLVLFWNIWRGKRWARIFTGWAFIVTPIIFISLLHNNSLDGSTTFLAALYAVSNLFCGVALLGSPNMRLFFNSQRIKQSKNNVPPLKEDYYYDIAISFAGEDRPFASKLADHLQEQGLVVFYDELEAHKMLGKNLATHLQNVYRDSSRFCIVIVSANYIKKAWTLHEWEQIQDRMLTARINKKEYLLPVRLDNTELPGLSSVVGYIDYHLYGAKKLSDLVKRKFLSGT